MADDNIKKIYVFVLFLNVLIAVSRLNRAMRAVRLCSNTSL